MKRGIKLKFTVLNGSPKGNESVSLHYILYIQKKHPEHEYKVYNVAQKIKRLEKDSSKLHEVLEDIKSSDGVIWSFPVYVMLICSQFKRFIELIFENSAESYFKDKYTVALSTSIHFYDHTANNYIHSICDDLGMKYVDYFAADSWDLLYPDRRKKWLIFMEAFFKAIENNEPTVKYYKPLEYRDFTYEPQELSIYGDKIDTKGKKVLILSEDTSNDSNLGKMVNFLKNVFSNNVELVNIHDINMAGPCIGCVRCGYNHECVYKDKDGFTDFWNNKVLKTDILIFAGNIKDRYLSSRWKMIFDRSFFNNHVPTLMNKQIGYIISGPFSQIPNLKEMFTAQAELQRANIVNFISDEFGDSKYISSLLYILAKKAVEFSRNNFVKMHTFLGEGGMKIFRDDIYGRNRFVFLADHEWYEKHGVYDTFPQNDERAKKMNEKLIPLMKIDKVRNKINMVQEFLRPFKKLIEKVE
ncbi:MAG: NAD(P)H-dependent oxidoreductase [Promethearchaeota archaeon]